MNKRLFNLVALPEAVEFLDSLPSSVIRKIYFNIDKVAGGVKDPELFKKTYRYYLGIPYLIS